MNNCVCSERAKSKVADALFEKEFSQDPVHNWHMACLIIDQPQFEDLCHRADGLKHYSSTPEAMESAKDGLMRDIAQMIHDASLGLPEPCVDTEANWYLAEQLLPVLAETLPLLTEAPSLAQCA